MLSAAAVKKNGKNKRERDKKRKIDGKGEIYRQEFYSDLAQPCRKPAAMLLEIVKQRHLVGRIRMLAA